jgi:DNA-binding NtrC family response regulator
MALAPPIALVVENDEVQRRFLSSLLRDHGMEVIECESAEAGELVLARTGLELNVMITDVALGGEKDGIHLAEFALSKSPNLPVAVVSGEAFPAIPRGAQFLPKPFQPDELFDVILRQRLADDLMNDEPVGTHGTMHSCRTRT